MHALLHHLWQLLVWWWSHRNAGTIDHPLGAGFLIPIITAIIAIATTVARFVADAGILVFKTLESAVKFAAKGVVWLTGVTRKGFSELLGGLQHTFKSIERWLGNLYCDYQRLKDKLERVFGPIVRFMQKVQRWYDMIWKRWVVPVLNLMQRMRKVLAIFKLFHLKWAQKLDADLAWLEGKIAKNFLFVRRWLNLFGNWVNFLVDPAGALRMFPLVAGFFAALNVTWTGLFGSPFTFWPGHNPGGSTTHVSVTFGQLTTDRKAGAGDAATIRNNWGTIYRDVSAEMGKR